MFHSSSRRISSENYSSRFNRTSHWFPTVLGLLLILSFVRPALASHYRVEDVPDVIPVEHHAALLSAGIATTEALYLRGATPQGRKIIAKKTGIERSTIRAWVQFLDIMQINGIGPKMVRLLNAAGVHGLRDLQKEKAGPLRLRMKAANRGFRYSRVLPDKALIGVWIKRALKTPKRFR